LCTSSAIAKEREGEEKRFLIAIRSFHQAQSQSTNQIKGNYRKKEDRAKEKKKRRCIVMKSIHRVLFCV
jgi:hypothetical protein